MESQDNLTTSFLHKAIFKFIFFAVVSIVFKVIPHAPNFSPQLVCFLYLGTIFPKQISFVFIISIAVLSDVAAALIFGYDIFGSCTLFTYSAFVLIAIGANIQKFSVTKWSFIPASFLSGLGFWLWTNFGVWLSSGLYEHTFFGLTRCYLLAWPFLSNTLISAIVWGSVFFMLNKYRFWSERKILENTATVIN